MPTANCHPCGKGERNGVYTGELRENHDASIGDAAVGEKTHLRMERCQTVKKIRPLAAIELCLSEGISK